MKCLKMKVTDVLLFITNLITIYSVNVPQKMAPSNQMTALMDEEILKRNFDNDCPQLSKIIHENNLTDFTADCKMLEDKTGAVKDENLLQQACIIVKEMLSFICEKKLNVTTDLFKLDKVHIYCPLNFSQWLQLVVKFNNYELVKKLSNKDDCSKLGVVSRPAARQWVLLYQLTNYFGPSLAKQVEEIGRPATVPKHTKPTTQNTENSILKTKGKFSKEDEVHSEVDRVPANPEPINVVSQNFENGMVKTKEKSTQKDEAFLEVDRPIANPELTKVSQNTENSNIKNEKLTQPEEAHLRVHKLPAKPEQTKVVSQNPEGNIVSKKQENEPESKTKEMGKSKSETTYNKMVGTEEGITGSIKKQNTEKVTASPNEEEMPKSELKPSENESLMPGDEVFKPELEDQNEDIPNEGGAVDMEDSLPDRPKLSKSEKLQTFPPKEKEIYPEEGFFEAEDSHFFFYFIMVSSVVVVCYLAFHNKNKILAYALEGSSGRRSRRRPNRARYRKLETNLEEVISSNTMNSAVSSVVY